MSNVEKLKLHINSPEDILSQFKKHIEDTGVEYNEDELISEFESWWWGENYYFYEIKVMGD